MDANDEGSPKVTLKSDVQFFECTESNWNHNEGMDTFINDEHPSKAEVSIETTEEGIDICSNNEQSLYKPSEIDWVEAGREILLSEEHPLNE